AEYLAARMVNPAAVHLRLRLRLVPPVVEPAVDRERQRGRHVDEHIPLVVWPASLEHEHLARGVSRQPAGQRAPGRATANDDEVVACRHHDLSSTVGEVFAIMPDSPTYRPGRSTPELRIGSR